MLHRKILLGAASIVLAAVFVLDAAHARAVRVDGGNWDESGFLSTDTTQSLGFNFDFFGVTASSAQISANGGLTLSGGGNTAQLNPFFDTAQSSGGNTAQFQFGVTNANFNAPGVDSGFRVSWQVFDATGSLLNQFQLSLFSLTSGQFAMEFNYDSLLLGDAGSQLGFSTSLGDTFDLAAALGLGFADYSGIGDDGGTNNCTASPSALACNNFFFNSMAFGPAQSVLPDIANGFFRQIDSNGDPTQGRYLFLTGATQVAEPGSLALLALGTVLLAGVCRRRPSVGRRLAAN